MKDTPSKSSVPDLMSAAVSQRQRMAMGDKTNGQTIPSAPSNGKKTPA